MFIFLVNISDRAVSRRPVVRQKLIALCFNRIICVFERQRLEKMNLMYKQEKNWFIHGQIIFRQ